MAVQGWALEEFVRINGHASAQSYGVLGTGSCSNGYYKHGRIPPDRVQELESLGYLESKGLRF